MITNNELEKIKGHALQPYRKEYVGRRGTVGKYGQQDRF